MWSDENGTKPDRKRPSQRKAVPTKIVKKEESRECVTHKWVPLVGNDKGKNVPTFLFTCLNCGDLKVGTQTIKISRYRLDMGELPMNSIAGIKLMNGPSVDATASGLIIGADIETNVQGIGAPLFMKANGFLAAANATTSATAPCVGLAMDSGTGNKRVLLHGVFRLDAWAWSTGPGTAGLIYLDISTGTLTQLRPSGTDQVIQPVGWALASNCIYFMPSMMYLTHI